MSAVWPGSVIPAKEHNVRPRKCVPNIFRNVYLSRCRLSFKYDRLSDLFCCCCVCVFCLFFFSEVSSCWSLLACVKEKENSISNFNIGRIYRSFIDQLLFEERVNTTLHFSGECSIGHEFPLRCWRRSFPFWKICGLGGWYRIVTNSVVNYFCYNLFDFFKPWVE